MFNCGYCGHSYDTVEERMKCEKNCRTKKIKEEEEAKAAKQKESMEKDYENLEKMIDERNKFDNQIVKEVSEFQKKYHNEHKNTFTTFLGYPFWF